MASAALARPGSMVSRSRSSGGFVRRSTMPETDAEMRATFPRYAVAFDAADRQKRGHMKPTDCLIALRDILGGSLPLVKAETTCQRLADDSTGRLDFKSFCSALRILKKFIAEELPEESNLRTAAAGQQPSKPSTPTNRSHTPTRLLNVGGSILRSQSNIGGVPEAGSNAGSRAHTPRNDVVATSSPKNATGLHFSERGAHTMIGQATHSRLHELVDVKARPTLLMGRLAPMPQNQKRKTRVFGTNRVIVPPRPANQVGPTDGSAWTMKFSPDGEQLAIGFLNGSVKIFRVFQRAMQDSSIQLPGTATTPPRDKSEFERAVSGDNMPRANSAQISMLRWRPTGEGDRQFLTTVDSTGTIAMWSVPTERSGGDVESSAPSFVASSNVGCPLACLAYTADGSNAFVAGTDRTIRVVDTSLGAMSRNGSLQITQKLGGSSPQPGKVGGHTLKVRCVCAHPKNRQVFISSGLDRQILIWDMRAGRDPVGAIFGPLISGDALNLSNDGNSLLAGCHQVDMPLQIFDVRTLQEQKSGIQSKPNLSYDWTGDASGLSGRSQSSDPRNSCLLFTTAWDCMKNNTIVAGGEKMNMLRVFERTEDPQEPLNILGSVEGGEHAFFSSAISNDGDLVACGAADGSVRMIEIKNKVTKF
eukprot:TRINITY_DN20386_c0_g1_i1.p1 TRINITY_DN20386_c0_g1~~TRINITY_DN20386_c0_g1_i1.p1  ORF type:complete len:646 (-),score=116.08 TRINITY_DN20386_c0_g1_i1:233-2170(-)